MREYKIGEIFKHNSEWYQCVEDSLNSCVNCCFYNGGNKKCSDEVGEYSKRCRSDETSVIFKKLEKAGEKFLYKGKQMQSYIRATDELICNWNNNLLLLEHGDSDIIDIEIKQNKEDMEENKQCGDTRFRIIARAKEHLFQATNIAEDKKELQVLDSFLLRCWQMGWLKQYEDAEEKKLNLRPFDIQKAREGKPVCTRDGHKAMHRFLF